MALNLNFFTTMEGEFVSLIITKISMFEVQNRTSHISKNTLNQLSYTVDVINRYLIQYLLIDILVKNVDTLSRLCLFTRRES